MLQSQAPDAPTADKLYTFFIDVEIPGREEPPKMQVALMPDYTVAQGVLRSLDMFNDEHRDTGIELEPDLSLYSVRLAKKSGKPKMDMPQFDPSQKMVDLKIDSVAIYIKNKEAAIKHTAAKPSMTPITTPSLKTKDSIKGTEVPELPTNINNSLRSDIEPLAVETRKKVSIIPEERISMDITVRPPEKPAPLETSVEKKKGGCFSSLC